MPGWRWIKGGIEIDGTMHGYAPRLDEADVADFIERANRVSEIIHVLEDGREAFRGGRADYRHAAENLGELLTGRRGAVLAWNELLRRLGGYFQPRPTFAGLSRDESERFTYEATLKLAERLDEQRATPAAPSETPKG